MNVNPTWLKLFFENSQSLLLFYCKTTKAHFSSPTLEQLVADGIPTLLAALSPLNPKKKNTRDIATKFNLELTQDYNNEDFCVFEFVKTHAIDSGWRSFVDAQNTLQDINMRLSRLTTVDDILKHSVLEAQQYLSIDRIGMLMYDKEADELVGTWGTDEKGQLNDEHGSRSPVSHSPWVEEVMMSRDYVAIWNNVNLKQWENDVGFGWNAIAAMWDEEQCIGWICCDNLINLKPMQPWLREVIAQLAKIVTHLIIQCRQRLELEHINDKLEQLVKERSAELQTKIDLLESAKSELIESEKLASLGALVAGVAHEVNTPLGISVTAASHLSSITSNIEKTFQDQRITKQEFERYLHQAVESADIILSNLERSSELILSFKQLAVDQSNDIKDCIKLSDLTQNLIKSFKHHIKNREVSINNNIAQDLVIKSFPSKLNQIISNLINNALCHAFTDGQAGEINISATLDKDSLNFEFYDNGKGVPKDKLNTVLEPFYTTKRGQGGTGLGLNIVHNIVQKLNGHLTLSNHSPHGLHISIDIPVEVPVLIN